LVAIEGRGRRFAEPNPPVPVLLGLVGVGAAIFAILEGDLGVPCVASTRLLGEPLRVTPDLLLLIEEILDMEVVRAWTTDFRDVLVLYRVLLLGLRGDRSSRQG
jgi:hypothetical protein